MDLVSCGKMGSLGCKVGLLGFGGMGWTGKPPGSETGAADVGSGEDSGRTSYMEDL